MQPPASLDQMISWYASPRVIPGMLATAARQDAKDRLFLQRVRGLLRPGTVLELGAGVGQLSRLLNSMGFDVTASDIHPHLVAFMRAQGLRAEVVDARKIDHVLPGPFDNVLTCGLHTLLTKNLEGAVETYRSAFRVLREGGRFTIILGNAHHTPRWCTVKDHLPIIASAGFRIVTRFRDQALPSTWYARLPCFMLHAIDATAGRLLGVRNILVLERHEPPPASVSTTAPAEPSSRRLR